MLHSRAGFSSGVDDDDDVVAAAVASAAAFGWQVGHAERGGRTRYTNKKKKCAETRVAHSHSSATKSAFMGKHLHKNSDKLCVIAESLLCYAAGLYKDGLVPRTEKKKRRKPKERG